MEELGAVHVPLKPFKPGMKVATLRRWNKVLELKPNLAGLGLNLNAAIEEYLNDLAPEGRPLGRRMPTDNSGSAVDDSAARAGMGGGVAREAGRWLRWLRGG